jgi:hypothetical protein
MFHDPHDTRCAVNMEQPPKVFLGGCGNGSTTRGWSGS